MSLLDDRPTNPAKFFIKVKSGALSYYDKESQENVTVPTPFEFIVLDQFATVKGWSDQDESGYWSNEVKSVGKDTLNVRTSKGLKESGIWRDIKGSVGIAGAKYSASIYVASHGRDGLEITNLSFMGAALKAWIEFTKHNDVRKVKVTLADWADDKKGSVKFKTPVFVASAMDDAERDEAVELAKELRVYHNEYFSYTPDEEGHTASVGAGTKDVVIEDIDTDEPINLDDIPF